MQHREQGKEGEGERMTGEEQDAGERKSQTQDSSSFVWDDDSKLYVHARECLPVKEPNRRYLASVSSYDSSNPTKDWGFPHLYANLQSVMPDISGSNCQSYHVDEILGDMSCSKLGKVPNTAKKHQNLTYRDRAAERRRLHGDFSIAPGQKYSENDEAGSSSQYYDAEDAAAEAINISFGSGSYARRILESMGWNDGEALGNSRKGILEPVPRALLVWGGSATTPLLGI